MSFSLRNFVRIALPVSVSDADVQVIARAYINYCTLTGGKLPSAQSDFNVIIREFNRDFEAKLADISRTYTERFSAAGFRDPADLKEFPANTKVVSIARRRAFFDALYTDYPSMVVEVNSTLVQTSTAVQEVVRNVAAAGVATVVLTASIETKEEDASAAAMVELRPDSSVLSVAAGGAGDTVGAVNDMVVAMSDHDSVEAEADERFTERLGAAAMAARLTSERLAAIRAARELARSASGDVVSLADFFEVGDNFEEELASQEEAVSPVLPAVVDGVLEAGSSVLSAAVGGAGVVAPFLSASESESDPVLSLHNKLMGQSDFYYLLQSLVSSLDGGESSSVLKKDLVALQNRVAMICIFDQFPEYKERAYKMSKGLIFEKIMGSVASLKLIYDCIRSMSTLFLGLRPEDHSRFHFFDSICCFKLQALICGRFIGDALMVVTTYPLEHLSADLHGKVTMLEQVCRSLAACSPVRADAVLTSPLDESLRSGLSGLLAVESAIKSSASPGM